MDCVTATGKNVFKEAHFHDEDAAREWFEAARWPDGPVCPHCGSLKHYETKKPGVYRCASKECRKDFTVTTKSVMESSHIKLHIWLQAFALMTASKKGMSAHQLHRSLKVTYKTAWFLAHRIREAMREGGLTPPPMGGEGKVNNLEDSLGRVVGRSSAHLLIHRFHHHRDAVFQISHARPFHVAVADKNNVATIVADNIARESNLYTDESKLYTTVGAEFAAHETVRPAPRFLRIMGGPTCNQP